MTTTSPATSFLLLCAHALVAPVLLSGMLEVDQLLAALSAGSPGRVHIRSAGQPRHCSGRHAERPPAGGIGLSLLGLSFQHGWTCTRHHRQFHVAHLRGCSTLINKHTCELDIDVYSICVPADKAHCSGCAFDAVVSKARLRRTPRKCKSSFTIMSLH